MTGEIVAETVVTIRRTGSLDGNVRARSINVEKGGTFSGQLIIGQKDWEQAELIPSGEERAKPRAAAKCVVRRLTLSGCRRPPSLQSMQKLLPRSPYERLGDTSTCRV